MNLGLRTSGYGLLLGAATAAPVTAQCLAARPGSPYDFVAGTQTIFATDFSSDPVGEFPAGLEFKQGAMEVAMYRGKKALKASAPSAFAIPIDAPLPESFSVELVVVNRNTRQVGAATVKIYGGRRFLSDFETAATRAEYGPVTWGVTGGGSQSEGQFTSDDADACVGQEVAVRLQVDGARAKLYADERRLAAVPATKFHRSGGIVVALEGRDDGDNAVYLISVRVTARGAPAPAVASSSAPVTQETPATTTTTVAKAAPVVPGTKATMDTGTVRVLPPTGVRVEQLNYRGTMLVHWDSMPGAVGYAIVRKQPDGRYGGVNPLSTPAWGPERKQGITLEMEQGPVELAVVADYGNGQWSAPSPFVATAVPRFHGRYRLSVLGFKADRETLDDPLETDGKRDEVYLRAAVAERGPDGQLVGAISERQTYVHGDVNAEDWKLSTSPNYRIKAGSASSLGGIRTGDAHPTGTPWIRFNPSSYDRQFPLLLWEGELYQGENTVQVALRLWETDQRPGQGLQTFDTFSPEAKALDRAAPASTRLEPTLAGKIMIGAAAGAIAAPAVAPLLLLSAPALVPTAAYVLMLSSVPLRLPVMPRVVTPLDSLAPVLAYNNASLGISDAMGSVVTSIADGVVAYVTDFEQNLQLSLNIKDRPLGIRSNGPGRIGAVPAIVTLSMESAESEALAGNGPANLGPGVYALRFEDKLTNSGGNGIYTVYIQVERMR